MIDSESVLEWGESISVGATSLTVGVMAAIVRCGELARYWRNGVQGKVLASLRACSRCIFLNRKGVKPKEHTGIGRDADEICVAQCARSFMFHNV